MNESTARQRSRTYADLARGFSEAEPGMEQEFTRLFVGPGKPVAHPYESVYREGRTMGETTLDVRHRLACEGLTPSRHTLADHVGIEFAFMAHLAAREALAWEAGEGSDARRWLVQQESFLRDHLSNWLPQFCRRVLVGRPLPHYAELAQRADTFVSRDASALRAWLGNDAVAAGAVAAERQWWAVTVGQACTLCHVCVEMCQPGALVGVRDENAGVVSLRLDPNRCDGCAACARWCPEGAIEVGKAREDQPTVEYELARSRLLACPTCGRLHLPETMTTKIETNVGRVPEALLQRLMLCYDCRVTNVPLRRHNAKQHGIPSQLGDLPPTSREE
jgi:TorA maturation chaperone TorD/Pyruvate/2-oxoacid:ferredoxin oxidoreductase delta subunit